MTEAQQALCEDCGLCCDGTLFESVEVDAATETVLAGRRLTLVRTSDGAKLPLPCECLEGVSCTIYEQRPRRCRTFECELLRRVDDERLSIPVARAVIDEVRRRRTDATLPKGVAWWTALASLRRTGAQSPLLEDLLQIERLVRLRFWQ